MRSPVHFGGGGWTGAFDGNSQLSLPPHSPLERPGTKTPLARGFVTLGSDSGHQGTAFEGVFLKNDEALANDKPETTSRRLHDVAAFPTQSRYGKPVTHSYYMVVQAVADKAWWPPNEIQRTMMEYFDFPASELLGFSFAMGRVSQASLARGIYYTREGDSS